MGGGIHPPLEVMLKWPPPNEINPETRSNAILILAYVGGPITILMLLARLWVRIFHQRSPGWDDWIMLVAMVRLEQGQSEMYLIEASRYRP